LATTCTFFQASHCYAAASLPLSLSLTCTYWGAWGWKSRTAAWRTCGSSHSLAASCRRLRRRSAMRRHRGDSQGQDSPGRVGEGMCLAESAAELGLELSAASQSCHMTGNIFNQSRRSSVPAVVGPLLGAGPRFLVQAGRGHSQGRDWREACGWKDKGRGHHEYNHACKGCRGGSTCAAP
jgi:hypothetical protein